MRTEMRTEMTIISTTESHPARSCASDWNHVAYCQTFKRHAVRTRPRGGPS